MKNQPNAEYYEQDARLIDWQLKNQKEDLKGISSGLTKSSKELAELRNSIDEAASIMVTMESSQSAVNFEIQRLKLDLSELGAQREMLRSQVDHYGKQKTEHTVQKMNVPSLFFEKATRQSEQIIRQYEAMVDDAEAVLTAIEAQ